LRLILDLDANGDKVGFKDIGTFALCLFILLRDGTVEGSLVVGAVDHTAILVELAQDLELSQ